MNTISSVWPVRSWVCALVSALALVGATAAHAEEARQNVLTFQSTAMQEFTQDLMTVTLQVTREGTQAADVQTALKRHGITYPVAQDNGYATWNNYSNRYWPAQYIVDKNGKIVFTHAGEGLNLSQSAVSHGLRRLRTRLREW